MKISQARSPQNEVGRCHLLLCVVHTAGPSNRICFHLQESFGFHIDLILIQYWFNISLISMWYQSGINLMSIWFKYDLIWDNTTSAVIEWFGHGGKPNFLEGIVHHNGRNILRSPLLFRFMNLWLLTVTVQGYCILVWSYCPDEIEWNRIKNRKSYSIFEFKLIKLKKKERREKKTKKFILSNSSCINWRYLTANKCRIHCQLTVIATSRLSRAQDLWLTQKELFLSSHFPMLSAANYVRPVQIDQ